MPNANEIMKGLYVWTNPVNRFAVLEMYFYADKYRDPDLKVCALCGLSAPVSVAENNCACGGVRKAFGQEYFDTVIAPESYHTQQQEYYINFNVSSGKKVFTPFSERRHIGKIKIPSRPVLYRGWDFGTHNPAVAIAYNDVSTPQFSVLYTFIGYNITFRIFCDKVIGFCDALFKNAVFLEAVDPSGSWASGHGGIIDEDIDTPVRYMQERHGMDVTWSSISPTSAIDLLSASMIDVNGDGGPPGFMIHQVNMSEWFGSEPNTKIFGGTQILIDGFNGEYHYKLSNSGVYGNKPTKNLYSHPVDALLYAFVRAKGHRDDYEVQGSSITETMRVVPIDKYGLSF